jgi:antitoxin YefM
MEAISYTTARATLSSTMEKVCNDHAPVIITRKSEAPVVMMSLEDYEAMEETTYLLRSPANARKLLESIAELETGKGLEKELLE